MPKLGIIVTSLGKLEYMKRSANTSSLEYHRYELSIVQDPRNPKHLIPNAGNGGSILDIGCGAGQTLFALPGDRQRTGVDVDVEALRFGSRLAAAAGLALAAASGEDLPFREQSFDFVYSRVALPYMAIPVALSEMYRVLRPSGRLWLTLHPVTMPITQFRKGNLKGKVYAGYVLLNGLYLHLTGRTFRFVRGMCESFQTERGMKVALVRAGFSNLRFERTEHFFMVTATRPERHHVKDRRPAQSSC